MRSSVLIASAGLAISAGTALADYTDIELGGGAAHLVSSFKIGSDHPLRFDNPGDPAGSIKVYDNEDDPAFNPGVTSFIVNNGGATTAGAAITTRMIMDDLHTIAYTQGSYVQRFYFSVTNGNAVPVSVRPRVRFWYDQNGVNPGASSGPGNPVSVSGALGFSFTGLPAIPANTVQVYYTQFTGGAAQTFPLTGTGMLMWAGLTYDNLNAAGATPSGVTAAQLNLCGQYILNPSPTAGTSESTIFRTTNAGNFLGTANVPGSKIDLGAGNNVAWEFVTLPVPAPSTVALLGLGGLITARRRRS